ncbi:MAG: LytTR family transcriptional regulator [Clostridiales bacterium]|nr:LytTR family transcriptional regulator [Clostridiales bacterium]
MRVTLKENKTKNDIEVLIEYPEMSETVNRIEHAVKSVDNAVRCFDDDGNICFVHVSDIFYIESVDKQVFIYIKEKVYRAELQLYQYAEKLYSLGFEQISKSCVLNLNTLVSVKPIFNSKMEALLENGEKVLISRNFIPAIKKRLEKML